MRPRLNLIEGNSDIWAEPCQKAYLRSVSGLRFGL